MSSQIIGQRQLLGLMIGLLALLLWLDQPGSPTLPTTAATEDIGAWSYALARLPVPTGELAVVELEGYIYAIGGVTAGGRTTNVWRYNPANDAAGWEKRASFAPPGLDHIMAAAYSGKIYVFGGLTSWPFNAVSSVFAYDPLTDSWARKRSMPQVNGAEGLGAAGIAVLGDTIYIVGGANRSGHANRQALSTLLAYSPATDSWETALPSMPTRRDHLVLIALDGKLHAIGGRDIDIGKVTGAHEIYDPVQRQWSMAPALPIARAGLGGGVLGGRIVVFGGEISGSKPPGGVFPNTDEYNPATNSWRALSALPDLPGQTGAGRHGTNGAVLNETLYVPGGSIKQGNAFTDITAAFRRILVATATATTTPSSPATTPARTPTTLPTSPAKPTAASTATTSATATPPGLAPQRHYTHIPLIAHYSVSQSD